ncbi:2-oxoglutarate oxidoreductase subunit KorA [bacterium HR21]|nr:2-oxoglutarate oxidoreductase subunit KorA [bacterium HR21]
MEIRELQRADVVIVFAGDSGDGMQLSGTQFAHASALHGNDIATLPNYPAEIRAPQGTLAGVSSFQLRFGSFEVLTPGDECDVLVALNAAALRTHLPLLKRGGILIVNEAGFDRRSLRLAGYSEELNPLTDGSLSDYQLIRLNLSQLVGAALADTGLSVREKERMKNMFVLGLLAWLFDRPLEHLEQLVQTKFHTRNPELAAANLRLLRAGYHFGETSELFTVRYEVPRAPLPPGLYRSISGNEALLLGFVTAAHKAGLKLFYAGYPITPASEVLHLASTLLAYDVYPLQAEDEIAALCAAIGAAFGGHLAVTATSGPGFSLMSEALGLAVMLELPVVVCDIQRAGPSTGMPTKPEQADLLQALYGRHGEAPLPVIAAATPAECFTAAYEAARIALQYMTPVVLLSDAFLANGSDLWRIPDLEELPPILPPWAGDEHRSNGQFLPYQRDERGVRPWAVPGVPGFEHRIGGLEKEHLTGNVSYDPQNHEHMVRLRAAKIARIAEALPPQTVTVGEPEGELAVVGWGSTYGTLVSAVQECRRKGMAVSHIHLRYLNPLPPNLGELLRNFRSILVPELNSGHLTRLLRAEYLLDARPYSKIQGRPLTVTEVIHAIEQVLRHG